MAWCGPARWSPERPQTPDHLHQAVTSLGQDRGRSSLDRSGGGLGIEGIGLALAASGGPVWPVDLDHDLAVGGQEPGQGSAVAAGASTPCLDLASRCAQPSSC
jgi:hypothetical protein